MVIFATIVLNFLKQILKKNTTLAQKFKKDGSKNSLDILNFLKSMDDREIDFSNFVKSFESSYFVFCGCGYQR